MPPGALQKAGTDEAEHDCAADCDGRLPAGDILQIVPHGGRILSPEVARYLVDLSGEGLGQTGNTRLVLGAEMLGGTPQGLSRRPELNGELTLTLPQARASPLSGLLEGVLGLIYHLVLHFPDLLPRAIAARLPGDLVLESTGLRVCHRHRKAPFADRSQLSQGAA
jgi:hypothetical protein